MQKFIKSENTWKIIMPKVLKAIDNDTKNSVFSFIPNTAETSFFGMIETVEDYLNKKKTEAILNGQRSFCRKSYRNLIRKTKN